MKKIFAGILILTLSLNCMQLNAQTSQVDCCDSLPQLKVLSWNIYMLPYFSIFSTNRLRAKRIVDKIAESPYQIVVFQEAFSDVCRGIIARGLRHNYPYQYGPVNKNSSPLRTSSGLFIVSKIPLKELGDIEFHKSKGFDCIARKGAALFEGECKGQLFQILATHLQADNPQHIRALQCEEIRDKLLIPNTKNQVPQIICGDFNIDRDDQSSYQHMLTTLDARNGEISGDMKCTYDEVNNQLACIPNGKQRVIDYILVRNTDLIKTVNRKVDTFCDFLKGRRFFLSDHYAMEADIHFNEDNQSFALK